MQNKLYIISKFSPSERRSNILAVFLTAHIIHLVGLKQSLGVDVQILIPWRHWTPKIESLGVLDDRQI